VALSDLIGTLRVLKKIRLLGKNLLFYPGLARKRQKSMLVFLFYRIMVRLRLDVDVAIVLPR
jgi:hypothetical protein